jgi:hypothetical protein
MGFKKIAGSLILVIGIFAFIASISNNNLNFALIYLTAALILWVLYGLLLDAFDVRFFAWIISASGFLVSISVFFMFGIEEVPYPVGAIVFHSGGLAGALGIGFFSLFPILILHQTGAKKLPQITRTEPVIPREDMELEIESNEWEMASDDDLQSGEFEVG